MGIQFDEILEQVGKASEGMSNNAQIAACINAIVVLLVEKNIITIDEFAEQLKIELEEK